MLEQVSISLTQYYIINKKKANIEYKKFSEVIVLIKQAVSEWIEYSSTKIF